MRPLDYFKILVFMFAFGLATSGNTQVQGTTSLQYNQQNLIQFNELNVPQSSQDLKVNLPEIFAKSTLSLQVSQIKQDFSKRTLTFKNGE